MGDLPSYREYFTRMLESGDGDPVSADGRASDFDPDDDPDLHIVTERECDHCGDLVLILSSRDWCDGCELEDDPE